MWGTANDPDFVVPPEFDNNLSDDDVENAAKRRKIETKLGPKIKHLTELGQNVALIEC